MLLDAATEEFVLKKTEEGDEGKYFVRVYSELSNSNRTTLSTNFRVTVTRETEYIVKLAPLWQPQLTN